MEASLEIRTARPDDYGRVVGVVDQWWGRPIAGALQRVFLDHFWSTSLVADRLERADTGTDPRTTLAGFLIGFPSPGVPGEAYIHFVGVAPHARGAGLGRDLYERFFAAMRAQGCTVVHAVTSPVNTGSIAFHVALGFTASDPVLDYDGPGSDRVVFTRAL